MARVVAVRHAERAVLVFEAAHRGILRMARTVDLVKRKSLQRADRQSDGHAVRKDGGRSVRVRLGDLAQRADHALAHVGQILAARNVPVRGVRIEALQLFTVRALQLRPRMILPHADADLTHARRGHERQSMCFVNGKRRRHRAAAVARIHRVKTC